MLTADQISHLRRGSKPTNPSTRKPKKPKRVLVTFGDLNPFFRTQMVMKDETGRIRCRWCNVLDGDGPQSKIVDKELALCRWCFDQIVDAKGRRCIYCQEVSQRRLEQGVCIACRGDAEKVPVNLERITKKLGWVAGMFLILIIPRVLLL